MNEQLTFLQRTKTHRRLKEGRARQLCDSVACIYYRDWLMPRTTLRYLACSGSYELVWFLLWVPKDIYLVHKALMKLPLIRSCCRDDFHERYWINIRVEFIKY